MTGLENIIREQISCQGPVSVADFMALALGHPQHGYYMGRDPLGRSGDFTTAPEISQLFGEMIGVWLADMWQCMGAPDTFLLAEAGPGRGTLMADVLRATRAVPGFHSGACIHLIETSPALRKAQKEALQEYDIVWHGALDTLPQDRPLFFVANEFFDALPVFQYVAHDNEWRQRNVGVNEKGGFVFVSGHPALPAERAAIESAIEGTVIGDIEGEIYEHSPAREAFMHLLCARLRAQSGAALIVDYGHVRSAAGETLQAVKGHRPVDVFTNIGECDLSAHVDFDALGRVARQERVGVFGPVEQGVLLDRLGIGLRAAMLAKEASAAQKDDLDSGLARLCSGEGMGRLFKALALVCCDQAEGARQREFVPAGFEV